MLTMHMTLEYIYRFIEHNVIVYLRNWSSVKFSSQLSSESIDNDFAIVFRNLRLQQQQQKDEKNCENWDERTLAYAVPTATYFSANSSASNWSSSWDIA